MYYSIFDIPWTDQSVNITVANRTANHNVPGDNKFDPWYIWPSRAKIPMGRVDLYDMPSFGSDTLLMKRYLDKNHLYRTGKLKAENRGLIDDNFGTYGGGFAQSGWRNFSTITGTSNYALDYFPSMRDSSFLFSYGCGAGSYQSANGIGNSTQFANDSLLNPFTMLFGSYFGDWDNTDNFLKAPLASKGWGLASAWSGYPIWMFHHSAQNYPIGLSTILALNAYPTYDSAFSRGETLVHIQLMGDPSLRLYSLEPLSNPTLTYACDNKATLNWIPSAQADSVEVWVYKDGQALQTYSQLASDSMINFTWNSGHYTLHVFAMDWEQNASGYFKVLSHPVVLNLTMPSPTQASMLLSGASTCAGDSLYFAHATQGKLSGVRWEMDGNLLSDDSSSFWITTRGNHLLRLIVTDSFTCRDTSTFSFVSGERPVLDSAHYANLSGMPSCDGGQNEFTLNVHYRDSNYRMLFYWGDSSTVLDYQGPTPFSQTHLLINQGVYSGKMYLWDSSGLCRIDSVLEAVVHPRPEDPILF
ncbi:MAG: hypothetical protein LPK45_10270, partial [Bacteroidota bacterium]|nr:hypothetical protein [Bacteroidota bacterium]MDX5431482.1 hypothetical protein [Bacteroidota bacterium]MDX5470206.1 hypothetical protein [Bacteroidota bacterium]